jgi:hypothetical protein
MSKIALAATIFLNLAISANADMLPPSQDCIVEGKIVKLNQAYKEYRSDPVKFKLLRRKIYTADVEIDKITSGTASYEQDCTIGSYYYKPTTTLEINESDFKTLKAGDKIKGITSATGDEYGSFIGFTSIEKLK